MLIIIGNDPKLIILNILVCSLFPSHYFYIGFIIYVLYILLKSFNFNFSQMVLWVKHFLYPGCNEYRDLKFEKFVDNEYECVSVKVLKQMCLNRTIDIHRILEKTEMKDTLKIERVYQETCCICVQEYVCDSDEIGVISTCKHEFHKDCIVQWTKERMKHRKQMDCPLCKRVFS